MLHVARCTLHGAWCMLLVSFAGRAPLGVRGVGGQDCAMKGVKKCLNLRPLILPCMSVSVQNVTRFYGEQKALDDVSFAIETGEIVAFIGPNGAGKSTMMKIITGFIPPTTGTVTVNGIDVAAGDKEIKKNIGYLPENNPLYPEMFVREYLNFIAALYSLPAPKKEHVDRVISITGLVPEAHKRIGSLSKGYRQRVGLAQALIHNPAVLILDEATSGLDPNQIIEIRNLIKETGREKTVMLSTHIMQEVEAICDRIIIIDRGRIVANESKDRIYSKIRASRQVVMVEFDRETGITGLRDIKGVTEVLAAGPGRWKIESLSDEDLRPLIFAYAVQNRLTVLSMSREESSLEEIFRQLTTA